MWLTSSPVGLLEKGGGAVAGLLQRAGDTIGLAGKLDRRGIRQVLALARNARFDQAGA